MPRARMASRVLPKLSIDHKLAARKPQFRPHRSNKSLKQANLYNGKRLIQRSMGMPMKASMTQNKEIYEAIATDTMESRWRDKVSKDVLEFYDDMAAQNQKLLPEELQRLVKNPANYFSRPQNVPNTLRQLKYFPNFVIQLNPSHHGPYYVNFNVPLWFSKLDLKDYLKNIYNVDVVHIRSQIRAAHVHARVTKSARVIRKKPHKRMVVQLVEPFSWPVNPKDIDRSKYDDKDLQRMNRIAEEQSYQGKDGARILPNDKLRRAIASQAVEVLKGQQRWTPTWTQLPSNQKPKEQNRSQKKNLNMAGIALDNTLPIRSKFTEAPTQKRDLAWQLPNVRVGSSSRATV